MALVGATTGLLALGAVASPVAAATQSVDFKLSTKNDVTTFVTCPAGTPANALCGYAKDMPLVVDSGLTGPVSESYVSVLEAPALVTDNSCPPVGTNPGLAMHAHSAVTIKTSKGDILLVTDGSFCTSTGHDLEPFKIIGGTGAYKGATGSGLVDAQQTSATSATETFTGTLKLAR